MAIKKSFRVKKSTDFDAIFKAKNSSANRAFVIYQRTDKSVSADRTLTRGTRAATPTVQRSLGGVSQSHYRVGLSVSKKLGNAVTRNRIKRLMREVIRADAAQLKAVDFVVIARKGVETMDFAAVKKNLRHLLKLAKIYKE